MCNQCLPLVLFFSRSHCFVNQVGSCYRADFKENSSYAYVNLASFNHSHVVHVSEHYIFSSVLFPDILRQEWLRPEIIKMHNMSIDFIGSKIGKRTERIGNIILTYIFNYRDKKVSQDTLGCRYPCSYILRAPSHQGHFFLGISDNKSNCLCAFSSVVSLATEMQQQSRSNASL